MNTAVRRQFLTSLTETERAALNYAWWFWARPSQLAPTGSDWFVLMLMTGRGFGKTRALMEWVRSKIEAGQSRRMAIVAPTSGDIDKTIIHGESGLLAISPPWFYPEWNSSRSLVTWPNGAIATCYSAERPDRLRGPEHDFAAGDELGAWKYHEAWDNLMFGLRLGQHPQICVATTPRPKQVLRDLVKDTGTHRVGGSTYDNLANLAPAFRRNVLNKYEGTDKGAVEIHGILREDTPGALWTREIIERARVTEKPDMRRIVVGVDPAVKYSEESCHTGIVVVGYGADGLYYVLEDASIHDHVLVWAQKVVAAYNTHKAEYVVAEVNNGGDLVSALIKATDANVAIKQVSASRNKKTRAEPVAMLYQQGQVKHFGTGFIHLEDEMCSWDPMADDESPDRTDALVWSITELQQNAPAAPIRKSLLGHQPKRRTSYDRSR